MNIDIKLHKNDLPDDLDLGNVIAVDGEFMGLNVRRDPLCLIQLSSGNSDAHIVQFDRNNYNAPNLVNLLNDNKITKIFHIVIFYSMQELFYHHNYILLPYLLVLKTHPEVVIQYDMSLLKYNLFYLHQYHLFY